MNNQRYSVKASNIEVFAPIGLYPGEKIIDNHFVVSVEVVSNKPYTSGHFIDYELIVTAVMEEFRRPHEILENVAMGIINTVAGQLQGHIASIHCDINKMRPAILGSKVDALGVSLDISF